MSPQATGSDDLKRALGDNIARCRRRVGISQEELSYRASLHRTEVSQLERGLRLARVDTLLRVAGALGVAVGDLLEGMAWRPGDVRLGRFERAVGGGNAED